MFGHFLNKLENEDLYFIMKDFIIQNDEKNTNTHLFSLTIKIILVDKALSRFKIYEILIFVLILFFANSVYAQEAFVYDDHGKRDPFVPLVSSAGMVVTYDEDLSVNDLVLEGIVADASGNNAAIVNGKVVKVHDQIGPYVVDVIAGSCGIFKRDRRFIIKIEKREGCNV